MSFLSTSHCNPPIQPILIFSRPCLMFVRFLESISFESGILLIQILANPKFSNILLWSGTRLYFHSLSYHYVLLPVLFAHLPLLPHDRIHQVSAARPPRTPIVQPAPFTQRVCSLSSTRFVGRSLPPVFLLGSWLSLFLLRNIGYLVSLPLPYT